MASSRASAGGRAEAAGGGYETLVAAWYCVRILLGRLAHPLFDLPADTRMMSLRSQAAEAVDDVNVKTSSDGVLFVNVKRIVGLTTGEKSPLAKALDQFVRQYKSAADHTSDAVRGRALDPSRDRLILATRSSVAGTIKGALARLLRGLRDQSDKNLLSEIPLNATETEVAAVVETHLRRSWETAYGAPPTPADLGTLLRLIHLQFIDVEPGERERLGAMDDLRGQILIEATEAEAAFSHLVAHCTRLRADQSGADTATLLSSLAQAGIRLQAAPDYRADIAALRLWTSRRLGIANRFTRLIDADAASVVERAAWQTFARAAQQESVLLVGDPGTGKSGLAYRLAQAELSAGRDVIFIPVDMLTVDSLVSLRAELGIAHDFTEILENWPGAQAGLLIVDALDAARKPETQTALRVTIEDVLNRAGLRWNVVASVRTYDLRQGTEWGRMFRGRPPAPDHADPSFRNVKHVAVARLTDDELSQVTRFSPILSGLFDAASPPLRILLRNIFNLRLLAELVGDGIVTSELAAITTQAELLDIYWTHRVRRSDGGHDRREQALRVVVDRMLASRSLQADRTDVLAQADPSAVVDLEQHDILRAEDEHGHNEDTLLFSHHVLFDYAVARLVFRRGRDPQNLADRLAQEPALALMLRPSLSLAFSEVWSDLAAGRGRFWNLAFAVASTSGVPAVGQLIGPMTIAEQAQTLEDLRPLLEGLQATGPRKEAAETILQHLTGAILARAKTGAALVGADAGPWMALAEALSAIKTDTAMMAVRILILTATEKPDDLSPEQRACAGVASRGLLDFAWKREPRIEQLVITGITGAANTIASDRAATVALFRKAIEPDHLNRFGYQEMSWFTRYVRVIAAHDAEFVIDLYAALYGREEASGEEKTSISSSAILGLISNRRQDYEMAWWQLGEAAPRLLDEHPVEGTKAVAAGIAGYVDRHEREPGSPTQAETFDFGGAAASYFRDRSYGWNGHGREHRRDAPVLVVKFEDFLDRLAAREDAASVFAEIVATVQAGRGDAVLWSSLLQAAANHPAVFGPTAIPLLSAPIVIGALETRYQAGRLLTAAFPGLASEVRGSIETSILALEGPGSENSKRILAGCIQLEDCVTEGMRAFKVELAEDPKAPRNRPAVEFNTSWGAYDTDAYLADLGVNGADDASAEIRKLMRPVEELPKEWNGKLTVDEARQRLDVIDPLVDGLLTLAQGEIDPTFYEHAAGTAAEAAGRIAHADYAVISTPDVCERLKRVLLFAKDSTFPAFSQEHEDDFHTNASWGGPSARNAAAGGLMALVRPQNPPDDDIRDAIRDLARDPVCDVRLQIVQNLYILRDSDRGWAWSEIEHVVQNEYTRTVVNSAIHALSRMIYQDVSEAIRIAKLVLSRYAGEEGPGVDDVCESAASLIMDIHFSASNDEADAYYASVIADPAGHAQRLHNWVARYSDNLTSGDDTGSEDDHRRAKTIAFYHDCAVAVSDELEALYAEHDLSKTGQWPAEVLSRAKALNGILDDMALRIYFASGSDKQAEPTRDEMARRWRLFRELLPVLDRLAECRAVHAAYYFIQALENFIPADPADVFRLIVKSVVSASTFGYAFEALGADLIVRIVESYLADHRDVFTDDARLDELMTCLNIFVNAGWPAAQSLTFRLADIWR